MISVFKTNVLNEVELLKLKPSLNLPHVNWNIDLADSDKILRIDSKENINDIIISLFKGLGFKCTILEVFHEPPI
ncbi:hypothetical protein [Pedobacter aquatilis]|uniref:hypothetical protein n=1 Tax=Pedobacter aquatilis TaxID=351343 RepID=UPI00292E49DB|nr:hypothetical protein [Pedobacter aquatilis]